MPVHPTIAAFLSTLPASDATPPDLVAWRAAGEAHLPPVAERPQVASVSDAVAETPGGDVPIRIYVAEERGPRGILVYIHGGAFFSGSLETHDIVARSLAIASGFTVITVGYRLAPEFAFPAGLTDCYAVTRWVHEHDSQFNWDGTHFALAGDSSGGTFVAAIAAMAHDDGWEHITHQVLLYPSVDLDFDSSRYASRTENAVGYGLETIALAPHNSYYLASGASPSDPRVSPILRSDLSGLPRALVITAEFDPLRDEGEAYAHRLEDAGVPTTVHRYAGATHGFIQHFGWLPEFAVTFNEIGEFVNS